jgi:hypothetical protein
MGSVQGTAAPAQSPLACGSLRLQQRCSASLEASNVPTTRAWRVRRPNNDDLHTARMAVIYLPHGVNPRTHNPGHSATARCQSEPVELQGARQRSSCEGHDDESAPRAGC